MVLQLQCHETYHDGRIVLVGTLKDSDLVEYTP